MAYDNDRFGYQRFSMFPPVIKWLLIINVTVFIIGMIPSGSHYDDGTPVLLERVLAAYGALWPLESLPQFPLFGFWQYFSYMFLHASFVHIFFNMLVLWMFGMELEQTWGSKRFLIYYILCGLGAGVVHSIVTLAMGTGGATVGASGAIMGVMIAFGLMFPDRLIMAFFFFPMRAKFAVFFFAAIDLYNGIFNSSDGIAHFAHLGGALIGYILMKSSGVYLRGGIFKFADRAGATTAQAFRQPHQRPQPTVSRGAVIEGTFREVPRKTTPVMNFGADQERIDAILDKISRHGYQSLTDEEKALLVEASKRMG